VGGWAGQAETSAEIDASAAAPEISNPEPEAGPGIDKPARELAGIDPEALATMTTILGNLAAAEAAPEQGAEKEARDWAAIEQAGIDEPVNHAEPQAELEAAAATERAEVEDADLEIRGPWKDDGRHRARRSRSGERPPRYRPGYRGSGPFALAHLWPWGGESRTGGRNGQLRGLLLLRLRCCTRYGSHRIGMITRLTVPSLWQ
jgi:hypothetical protein